MRGLPSSTCWLPAAMLECHATLGSCEQEPGRAHGLCAEESVGVTTAVRQTALGLRGRRCRFPAGPLSPFSTFTCSASFRLFAWFLSVSRVFCVGSLERWDSLKREWPAATCTSESESQLGSAWTTGLRVDHPVSLFGVYFVFHL